MTERKVDIHVELDDADAKAKADELKGKLDDLTKDKTIKVNLDTPTLLNLDRLVAKLDELSKRDFTPKIDLSGIAPSLAGLDLLAAKLDAIGRKDVTAKVKVKTDRSDLSRVDRTLGDGIDRAMSDAIGATLGARKLRQEADRFMFEGSGGKLGGSFDSFWRRMFHGQGNHPFLNYLAAFGGKGVKNVQGHGGAVAGYFKNLGLASQGTALGNLPILGQAGLLGGGALLGGTGILSLGGIISGLVESLSATGLGLGVGGLGAFGAYMTDKKPFSQVMRQAEDAFLSSLSQGHNAVAPGTTPKEASLSTVGGAPSFLQSLLGILHQISKFIAQISPELSGMFRASIPFIKMFVDFLEQGAKIMIPAFTQAMKNMTPALPIMRQGFVELVRGLAMFLNALGPQGMKAAAQIFLDVTKVIATVADGLGHTFNFLSQMTVDMWHAIHVTWDDIRHYTAVAWDDTRHTIATIWDAVWSNTIGRMMRGQQDMFHLGDDWRHEIANIWDGARHDVAAIWDHFWSGVGDAAVAGVRTDLNTLGNWRHDISSLFDTVRHDIATIWDNVWHDLEHGVTSGAASVVSGFHHLWTDIWNIVRHIPGILYKLGKEALTELWHGAESVGHTVVSWFDHLGHDIVNGLKSFFGIKSPSKVMFDLGKNLVLGLHHGIEQHIGMLGTGGMNPKVLGTNIRSWIVEALRIAHAPLSWLAPLEILVSKESGGNPRAIDPIGVAGGQHAEGLFQTIPSTFSAYSLGGSIFNPVADAVAGIRYIMATYRSPYNIPGLLSGNYRGYWNEGWVNEPVFGVGMRSGDMYGFAEHGSEYVSHGQGRGGDVYITVQGDTNPEAAAERIWQLLRERKRHHGGQSLGL